MCSVSADGRYVAFESAAGNLGSWTQDPNLPDVFVRDRQNGTTILVSAAPNGDPETGMTPRISGDGRFVAFASNAPDLVGGDTHDFFDVFVKDLQTGAIERVSVSTSGGSPNGDSGTFRYLSCSPMAGCRFR